MCALIYRYVYGLCMCLKPTGPRRECQVLWKWSYIRLYTMWVLGIEPDFSGRAAGAPNH